MATAPNSTTFYVYALARPVKKGYQIFYIGKGTKRRVFAHDGEARKGCKCHKCNVIRKVWREGGEIQRYILLTTESEQEAFEYEKEMIALHGRGNLCNQTDGGEGVHGRIIPPDELKYRSDQVRKARGTPEARKRQSEITRQWYADASPEQKAARHEKAATARRGKKYPKVSAAQRGKIVSQESRRRMSEGQKGRVASEETRRKMSVALKGRKGPWLGLTHSEETKRRMSESQKRVQDTLEVRERRSQQSKRRWADPEWKAKNLEAIKQGYRGKRTFTLRAPDGAIYTTDNLTQFCKNHELNYHAMYTVLWGKRPHRKSHRGWTNAE